MAKTPEELQAEFQAEQNKRIKRQQAIRKQATDLEDAKAKEKLDKEKASLVEGQERTLKWYEDQKASGENIDEWEHPGGRNESRVGQSFMERAVEISKRPAWDDSTSTPARQNPDGSVDLNDPNISSVQFNDSEQVQNDQRNQRNAEQSRKGVDKAKAAIADIDQREAARESNRQDQARFEAEREGGDSAYMQGQVDDLNAYRAKDQTLDPSNKPLDDQGMLNAIGDLAQKGEDKSQAKQGQERFNALMTERARARRGLPAIDQAARDAIANPELAKAYREGTSQNTGMGVLSQQIIRQQGQPGGPAGGPAGGQPAQAAAGPPQGGYQTGQSVALTNMPGGQESTSVYAMGNGIAIPDATGMSPQDFKSAYEQVNPDKSFTDGIQSLSREGGPAGNAARQILKSIGATGGSELTTQQKEQLEDELSGRAGKLLFRHAQDMQKGIVSGSEGLKRDQAKADTLAAATEEKERVKAETRNKAILTRSAAMGKDDDNKGTPRSELLRRATEEHDREQEFIETGKYPEDPSPAPIGVDFDEVRGDLPVEAFGEFSGYGPNGDLQYTAPDFEGPMAAVAVQTNDGPRVVPVLDNPDEADFLPPGQDYVLNGQLVSGKGKEEGTLSEADKKKARENPNDPSFAGYTQEDYEKTSKELWIQRQADSKAYIDSVRVTRDQEQGKLGAAVSELDELKAKQAKGGGDKDAMERQAQDLRAEVSRLEESVALEQERIQQHMPPRPTTEDITAELNRKRDRGGDFVAEATRNNLAIGVPGAWQTKINEELKGVQKMRSAEGSYYDFGGTKVPVKSIGGVEMPMPENLEQALAVMTREDENGQFIDLPPLGNNFSSNLKDYNVNRIEAAKQFDTWQMNANKAMPGWTKKPDADTPEMTALIDSTALMVKTQFGQLDTSSQMELALELLRSKGFPL
jgi:hypothetical protein